MQIFLNDNISSSFPLGMRDFTQESELVAGLDPQGLMDRVRTSMFGCDVPLVSQQLVGAATEVKSTFEKINSVLSTDNLNKLNMRSVMRIATAIRYFAISKEWIDKALAFLSVLDGIVDDNLWVSYTLVRNIRFSDGATIFESQGLGDESQFTSQAASKVVAIITSVVMSSLGYKMVASEIKSRVAHQRPLVDAIYQFGRLSYGVNGAIRIFELLSNYLKDIIERYMFENAVCPSLDKDDIIEWYTKVMAYDVDSLLLEISYNEVRRLEILEMRDKRDKFASILSRTPDKFNTCLYQEFSKASYRLLDICEKMKRLKLDYGLRVDPFCLCLAGEPGIGKSFLINEIIHTIANDQGIPNYMRVYNRNTSDPYWSNYHHQWCTYIEDFAQEYNSTVNPQPMLDFIKLKSNNQYGLTMADISEKGRNFTSSMIAMTTNALYPPVEGVRERDAVWRRRDMLVEIVLRPGQIIDKEKPDKREHLLINLCHPLDPIRKYIKQDVPWEEFLELVKVRYNEYILEQRNSISYMSRFHLQPQGDEEVIRPMTLFSIPSNVDFEDDTDLQVSRTPMVVDYHVSNYVDRRILAAFRGRNYSNAARRRVSNVLDVEVDNPSFYFRKLAMAYGDIVYGKKIKMNRLVVNRNIYNLIIDACGPFEMLKLFFGSWWDEMSDACLQNWDSVIPEPFGPWKFLANFILFGKNTSNFVEGPILVYQSRVAQPVVIERLEAQGDTEDVAGCVLGHSHIDERMAIAIALNSELECYKVSEKLIDKCGLECNECKKRICVFLATRGGKHYVLRLVYERYASIFAVSYGKPIGKCMEDAKKCVNDSMPDWLRHAVSDCDSNFMKAVEDFVVESTNRYMKFITERPWISAVIGVASVATIVAFIYGTFFSSSEQEPTDLWTEREIEQVVADYKSERRKDMCMNPQAYYTGETKIAPKASAIKVVGTKPVVTKVSPQGGIDANADDVVAKISKRIVLFKTVNKYRIYTQTALQVIGNMFIINRHCFSTMEKGDKIEISYLLGQKFEFVYDPGAVVCLVDTDLAAFMIPHPMVPLGPDLIKNFIKEDDLRFITNSEVQHVGIWKDGSYLHWQSFVTAVQTTGIVDGQNYMITRAWMSDYETTKGMCGAITVSRDPAVRRKLMGFHAARYTNNGSSISQLITQEMLVELYDVLCEKKYRIKSGVLDNTVESQGLELVGNFLIEKAIEVKRPSGKTKIVPTKLYGKVFDPVTGPSVLSPFDRRIEASIDPMLRAMRKYGKVAVPFRQDILDEIGDHLCGKIRIARSIKNAPHYVVTEDIAINGIPGSPHHKPLDMKTSPGYPYVDSRPIGESGKAYLFKNIGTEMEPKYVVSDQVLRKNIDDRLDAYKRGESFETQWTACLKDERRKFVKIRQGKTRLFTCPPIDFTIVARMYYMDYDAFFYSMCLEDVSTVGIDCENGRQWTTLFDKMYSKGRDLVAGDYEDYDGTVKPQVVSIRQRKVEAFYEGTEEEAQVRMLIIYEVIHSRIRYVETTFDTWRGYMDESLKCSTEEEREICLRKYQDIHNAVKQKVAKTVAYLVRKGIGITSGYNETVVIDTDCNEINMRYVFQELGEEWKDFGVLGRKDQSYFDANVALAVNGDDNMASPGEHIMWYNTGTIANCLAKYGMIYTSSLKDGTLDNSIDIFDVVYLKRRFKSHPYQPLIMCAPLDESSIRELINWTTRSCSPIPQLRNNYYDGLCFAYHHGREFFDKYRDAVESAFMKAKIKVTHYEFNTFDISFLEKCT